MKDDRTLIEKDYITNAGQHKTREQLVCELAVMRQRIAQLETPETEQIKSDNSLPLSQEHIKSLLEDISDVVGIINSDGTLRYLSPSSERVLGYTPAESIGQNAFDFVHPDDLPLVTKTFNQGIKTPGYATSIEYRLRHKNGAWHTFEVSAKNLLDDPAVQGIIVTYRDITEHKEAESFLRQSEENLRSLLNSMDDLVFIIDMDGTFKNYYQPEKKAGLYLPPDDFIGKHCRDVMPTDVAESLQSALKAIRNSGETQQFDYALDIQNKKAWYNARLSPIKDQQGNITAVTSVSRNITERKQLEQQMTIKDNAVASSVNAIAIADLEGNLTYVNSSFLQMWGYDNDKEVLGKSTIAFWQTPEQATEVIEAIWSKWNWIGELTARRSDGSTFDTQLAASVVKDEIDRPICMMASFTDNTEHKRMETALRESEQFNSSLSESSSHPIIVINPDTSIRYVNPALENLTGFTSEELVGRKAPYPWLTKDSLPKTRREFKAAIQKGRQWYKELYQNKDGNPFWVEITTAPVIRDGELKYYMASWVDITWRKYIEDELREEKERAQGYLNIAGVMLVTLDTSGEITLINKRGCEILGYREKELIGRDWFETLVPQRIRDEIKGVFHKLMAGNIEPAKNHENPLLTRNGEERLIAFNNAAIKDPNGKIVGVLFSGEDVTELRRTQEQLQHSRLLASLGEMTAGIAHEVNNPLGSILLYSELLTTNDAPTQLKKDLKVIHDEAKRATKIMSDLLTYGRRTKSPMRRLNLHSPLRKVLEMRRYEQKVKNIQLSIRLEDKSLYINGDSSQLMQVFMNLILNAEEALREAKGGILSISTHKNSDWATVSIADNGGGIPQKNLKQIFFPFFTTKGVGEGTGLGLSTCYGIITDHNGLIHAENNEMGGATFTIELPLAQTQKQRSSPGQQESKTEQTTVMQKSGRQQ